MTEEIKEILNNDIPMFVIDSDGYTIDITETIHNVITNLQQENEKLKDWNKKLIRDDLEYVNKSFEQNRYKSRIDKATSLYLKELSEKGRVDDLACKMFNTLEGNNE